MVNQEEKQLEELIKKLENTDIREWTYDSNELTLETCGLRFTLEYGSLEIKNIRGGPYCIYYSTGDIKNKPLKNRLIDLRNTIYNKLREHQNDELEEKIKIFLSE